MKGRNILIVTGVILIIFNLLAYGSSQFNPPQDIESKIGYLFGWNLLLIIGIILLTIAYFRNKKMMAKKEKDMIDNFLD